MGFLLRLMTDDRVDQDIHVERFHEVTVEAGCQRTLAVRILAVTGQGD